MPKQDIQYLNYIPKAKKSISKSLYTSPDYLSNSPFEIIDYCVYDNSRKEILAAISFQILDNNAVSLATAPFGGFSISSNDDNDLIKNLLKSIIADLKRLKYNAIVIKLAAPFYIGDFYPKLMESLSSFDFIKKNRAINHHIEVSKDALEIKMSSMEQRKLRKCVAADFKFISEPRARLSNIYDFIAKCRAEKKQSLSMSLQDIENAVSQYPNSYLLFSIMNQDEIIAASICVVVNHKVLYNFYPASKHSYNSYSPTVFLLSNIYKYCQENGFEYLDLGTSMLGSSPNKGLVQFKKSMGGISSEKLTYQLTLIGDSPSVSTNK